MLNKTIPERVFQVKDASGRQYKVTRYAWMESEADEAASAQWRETWHLLMTEVLALLVDRNPPLAKVILETTNKYWPRDAKKYAPAPY